VDSIKSINLDKAKLQECFEELNLHRIPALAKLWEQLPKTSAALQAKCTESIEAVESNLPSLVQFCHFASQHGSIAREGHSLVDLMSDSIHAGFVMEWATTVFASDVSLFKLKFDDDKEVEDSLTRDLDTHDLPPEALFLTRGESTDKVFGHIDTFGYLKVRSAELLARLLLDTYRTRERREVNDACYQFDGLNLLSINVLEAVWSDRLDGYTSNASAGLKVALGGYFQRDEFSIYPEFHDKDMYHFYKAWNLAFCLKLGTSAKWLLCKLLIPSVCNAVGNDFGVHHIITLQMVAQLTLRSLLDKSKDQVTAREVFTKESIRAFGRINEKWAYSSHLKDPKLATREEFVVKSDSFVNQCDEIHKNTLSILNPACFDTLLQQFIGPGKHHGLTWEELGVTSFMMLELQMSVEKAFLVNLPPDWSTKFPTPAHLEAHVNNSRGKSFERKVDPLCNLHDVALRWSLVNLLQGIGIILHLFLFVVPVVPAYYFGAFVSTGKTVEVKEIGGQYVKWLWLPLAVPTWMICFTTIVILSKWIVVGRYKVHLARVPSLAYLRWWFVDRLIHTFEFWVGRFIKDSILLWLVYTLMGAKIHPTAKLDAFVREFDLVSIGPHVALQHQIRCRKFGSWNKDDDGPRLWFRSTTIESQATVRGMVSLGSTVGVKSHVDKLCVLDEGSIIPPNTVASGNPAFSSGTSNPPSPMPIFEQVMLECTKISWLLAELYLFYCGTFLGQILFNGRLPSNWRLTPLLYWVLIIATSCVFSIVLSIGLKWLLIGRRRPGQILSRSVFRFAAEWIVDYHFRVNAALLASIAYSTIWNVIAKLHGMDIDLSSRFYWACFSPSNMDLIRVRSSFISASTFETVDRSENKCMETIIDESSIARNVHVNPGVSITRSVIRPMTTVSESVMKQEQVPSKYAFKGLVVRRVSMEVCFIIFAGLVVCSFIPAYKVFRTIEATESGVSMAVPALMSALLVQTATWAVLVRLLQETQVVFGLLPTPYIPLYYVYVLASHSFARWSMLPLLWGTRYFNLVARFLGVSFEADSRLLYFGERLDDFFVQTIGANTIIDGGQVFGHTVVYNNFFFGPNRVAGVLHEGTHMAHCTDTGKQEEIGPWRPFVGCVESVPNLDDDTDKAVSFGGDSDLT